MLLAQLIDEGWKTCDILDQGDYGIVLVKSQSHADQINPYRLVTGIGPESIATPRVYRWVATPNFHWEWTMAHNASHKDDVPIADIIPPTATIHPTAIIGIDGSNLAKHTITGQYLHARHLGYVKIGENVQIGAYSMVKRSLFPCRPTTIGRGTIINNFVNIGHHCQIGSDCMLQTGAILGGKVVLGNRVTVWMGATIRNGVTVCDDAVIGQGANVVKDILEPGVYVGNPATRMA